MAPQVADGFNSSFGSIYKVLALLSVLLLVAFAAMSLADAVGYGVRASKQAARQGLLTGETLEAQALAYDGNGKEEPFHVYASRDVLARIFDLVVAALIVLGLHFGLFFAFKVYATYKHLEFNDRADPPMGSLMTLGMAFVSAVALSAVYRGAFAKDARGAVHGVRGRMQKLKDVVYANLYADEAFLAAMRRDDMGEVVRLMRDKVARDRGRGRSANDTQLCKMFFTLNLFTFLRTEVPESDAAFDEMTAMFTVAGVRKKAVDPSLFVRFKRPAYVPNLYPSMRETFKDVLFPRERAFLATLSDKMRELNKHWVLPSDLARGKAKVRDYLITATVLSAVCSAATLAVGYPAPALAAMRASGALAAVAWERVRGWVLRRSPV